LTQPPDAHRRQAEFPHGRPPVHRR